MTVRRIFYGRLVVLIALFGLINGSVLAFKPAIHQEITSSALSDNSLTRMDPISGQVLQFTNQAISDVSLANYQTDCGTGLAAALCLCPSCQTDSSRHFDDEDFAGSTARLMTLKQQIINLITASTVDGASARNTLGQALHTIQDFYAHSNWIESGQSSIDSRLGISTYAGLASNVATSPIGDPGTLTYFSIDPPTTGWFPLPLPCDAPTGKTRHGVDPSLLVGIISPTLFLLYDCPTGLNKDDPTRINFGRDFNSAHALGVSASIDYVNRILNEPSVATDTRAIKALMGLNTSTLGMVVDDTGSMGDIIGQVQSQIAAIVNSVQGTPDEPDQYLLQSFNDPTIGTPFSTGSASQFINAVNRLFASGGGDCPELSMTGLLSAIQAADPGATLFLFTDASSKDSYLGGAAIAAAQAKNIQVNMQIFGSCSPIDPVYGRVAQQTGGQLFVLQRNEANQILNLAAAQLGGHPNTILSIGGTLAPGVQTVAIPVNSGIIRLTVAVEMDTKSSITLLQPSGSPVSSGPNVTLTPLVTGEVITIRSPASGIWQLQFSGSGAYSVNALESHPASQTSSTIDLHLVQFVTLSGRIAHEGLFPINGQPVAGTQQTLLAQLYGPFRTATFSMISQSGDTLTPLTLSQGNLYASPTDFVGPVTLPLQPFRIAVSGIDSSGAQYQRVFPELFQGQSVSIFPITMIDAISNTVPVTLQFTVTNTGSNNTFVITATDNCGAASNCRYITSFSPTTLSLATGASATVNVNVNAPAGTPDGTLISITVSAVSTTIAGASNAATQSLRTLAGEPGISIALVGKGIQEPGVTYVDLQFTNTGQGTAQNINVNQITATTLQGTGSVLYNSTLSPHLSYTLGTLAAHSTATVRVFFDVPPSVRRFRIVENGTVQDVLGTPSRFSLGQAIIP